MEKARSFLGMKRPERMKQFSNELVALFFELDAFLFENSTGIKRASRSLQTASGHWKVVAAVWAAFIITHDDE